MSRKDGHLRKEVEFVNHQIQLLGLAAVAMGQYIFTCAAAQMRDRDPPAPHAPRFSARGARTPVANNYLIPLCLWRAATCV